MKSKLAILSCLAVGILFTTTNARASIEISDRVAVGGFFSQGYLYSSNNNYPTTDKGGTWDFREMAVNASTTLGAHTRVGAQVFAQKLGGLGGDHAILDWAVIDYNVRQEFGVRVGRVKYPKGLYGEALDLDVVRPFAFLPTTVYSPVLRDFAASFDGAMIYGTINAGKSSFDYKAFTGDIPITPEKGVADFYNGSGLYGAGGVKTLGMDRVSGGQLNWNTPVNGLKFGFSYSAYKSLQTDGAFYAAPVLNLHSNIPNFAWHTYSAEYTFRSWTFATEWQRAASSLVISAPPALPASPSLVGWDAWYVSAARRLGTKWEVGTYFAAIRDRYPSSAGSLPGNQRTDKTISVRYDFNEHVLVKLEAQFQDGYYQVFNTTRIPNPAATKKDTNTIIAAKTTWSF